MSYVEVLGNKSTMYISFCNVWVRVCGCVCVCVGVCMFGFCNVWVCVCVGFVMCGYVCIVGFVTCGCVYVWVL